VHGAVTWHLAHVGAFGAGQDSGAVRTAVLAMVDDFLSALRAANPGPAPSASSPEGD